jgi:hypothetical protein
MKLNYWMVIKSIIVMVFGIGFVAVPRFMGETFGMSLDEGGILMARLFGTAFIFEAILLWLARNGSISEPAIRGIVWAVVVSNLIGFVVTLMASLNEVWNALGWLPVGLYLVLSLAFAYFLLTKSKS